MTDELYIPPPPKKNTRMLGIGLSLGGAALLLFAAFSKTWLARPLGDHIFGFGPMGCQNCGLDGTGDMSNGAFMEAYKAFDPQHASGMFAPMGWATFGVCVIAALGLIATSLLAFKKRRPELPMSPASLALLMIMIGLLTGCVFVATKPGPVGLVGVAMGFWSFGIGSVLGISGAQMLAKEIRPVDPDLLEGAMNPEQY